jgi:LuxR family maltose regulon positive regulatory protein
MVRESQLARPDNGGCGAAAGASRHEAAPRLPKPLLVRERLLRVLDVRASLTVVRAPLGFGKTTLVAQWLTARERSIDELVGWLQVTSDCSTADRFWTAAWQVLQDAGLPMLSGAARDLPAQQLRRALQRTGTGVLLVVDGLERVADPAIDRDLYELLRDCPTLRVVVCLRGNRHVHHPPPGLASVEITGRDLIFTTDETHRMVRLLGPETDVTQAAAIRTETGGWPELTSVVAQAMTGGDRPRLEAVTADYFRHRLLPEIDDDRERDALLASSVVDSLSAPLLAALVDGQPEYRLNSLEAAGLLSGSDDSGYRWPPGARRALADELGRRDPARATELKRRAANWYLNHGQPALALDQSLAAQRWQLATEIIDRSWRRLWRHHQELLARAFNQIPVEVLATRVRPLAIRDWRVKMPDDLFDRAVPRLPDDPVALAALGSSAEAFQLIDTGNILLVSLRHRSRYAEGIAYGGKLETIMQAARWSNDSQLVGAAASTVLQLGITRMLADDLPGARRSFQRAYDFTLDAADDEYVGRDAAGKLALVHAFAGDVRQAVPWLRRHDDAPLAITGEWFQYTVNSTAACARLLVALEQFDGAAAAAAVELDGPTEADEFWAYQAYADALYALHAGDAAAGLRTLHQHPRPNPAVVLDALAPATGPLLASTEADLLMALGRGNEARSALLGEQTRHPALRVSAARLALLSGRPEDVLAQTHDPQWARTATARWQQEMLLIRAIAHHRLGAREMAVAGLRRALATAAALDAWRAFATVPRHELDALAEALSEQERVPLTRLAGLPQVYPDAIALVELTPREQTILHHLAQGLTRTQLAQHLFISNNTVKYHLRGLYRKLGATSREQALSRARGLRLLPTTYGATDAARLRRESATQPEANS